MENGREELKVRGKTSRVLACGESVGRIYFFCVAAVNGVLSNEWHFG